MVSRVAVVSTVDGVSEAYRDALDLIGVSRSIADERRDVTVKVGIYDPVNLNYPSVPVLKVVVDSYESSERVWVAESDNHKGSAVERLQRWGAVFSDRVVPFDLSNDIDVREGLVCGGRIDFSHVLFKPNLLVSLHVLRRGSAGSVFKNLLGLVPDIRKERFHDRLGEALIDIARAVGWIDLAVVDGTYIYGSGWKEGEPLERERRDLLLVGRDPVAVEVVGGVLAGNDPLSISAIVEAKKRGLGETDIGKIRVLGESLEDA